jgi:hypothetical protein
MVRSRRRLAGWIVAVAERYGIGQGGYRFGALDDGAGRQLRHERQQREQQPRTENATLAHGSMPTYRKLRSAQIDGEWRCRCCTDYSTATDRLCGWAAVTGHDRRDRLSLGSSRTPRRSAGLEDHAARTSAPVSAVDPVAIMHRLRAANRALERHLFQPPIRDRY